MASDEQQRFSVDNERQAGRIIWSDDTRWCVYESHSPFDRRHGPTLLFESDAVVRRVRDYPANWRELSDDDLYAVSWRA
jgi:hypothetical protein